MHHTNQALYDIIYFSALKQQQQQQQQQQQLLLLQLKINFPPLHEPIYLSYFCFSCRERERKRKEKYFFSSAPLKCEREDNEK